MSELAAHRAAHPEAANRAVACWLGLAAAPTFALMAIGTALFGNEPDIVCMPMSGGTPVSGMTAMYLLMSVFHLVPWLRRLPARAGRYSTAD